MNFLASREPMEVNQDRYDTTATRPDSFEPAGGLGGVRDSMVTCCSGCFTVLVVRKDCMWQHV